MPIQDLVNVKPLHMEEGSKTCQPFGLQWASGTTLLQPGPGGTTGRQRTLEKKKLRTTHILLANEAKRCQEILFWELLRV